MKQFKDDLLMQNLMKEINSENYQLLRLVINFDTDTYAIESDKDP